MTSTVEVKSRQIGEAGHCGKDVRSDLHVSIEPRESGGLEIALESRVAPYYGASILTQARQTLDLFGVKHARVTIRDEGALPFVISARIESAAKRAGFETAAARTKLEKVILPAPPARDRLRRSRLYLAGSEPKFFINAALHGPDAIILDLEDSVHPDEKDAARVLVRNALHAVDFGACERMVRINQLPMGLEDLVEVIPEEPDMILIPKTERPEQVAQVEGKINQVSALHGIERPVWLMPILESALGIENAFAIAMAAPSVAALTIGLEDYSADLGVAKTSEGRESLYARMRLVNAAKASGVQAIDSVFSDVGDIEGLRQWGQKSRAMGFEGMGCIHPAQIPIVHEAFTPTPAEIEKALKIVAAFKEAQQKGLAVVSLGSRMIDPPVVKRAQRLLESANRVKPS